MTDTSIVLMLLLQSRPTAAETPTALQGLDRKMVCGPVAVARTKFVPPVYPDVAVKAGRSGDVVVEMVITATGETARPRVKKGVDPDLNQAAIDAVKQWEYKPFRVLGGPHEVAMSVAVRFVLPRDKVAARDVGGNPSPR